MRKAEIARRIARSAGVSEAEAADRLDRVVREILDNLRRGRPASLPGLGEFKKGSDGKVAFEARERRRRG
jgi:nucleoid DNA-binding protein